MDSQYPNAPTSLGSSSQFMLSADPSSQRSNVLGFKRLDPGSIAIRRFNGILVLPSCRPMTQAELGENGTSGTLFEGHIAPGEHYIGEAQKSFLDQYCQGISNVVNESIAESIMIEASAELEHKVSEHRRLSFPGELAQEEYDYAASQLATILQARHLPTQGVSNKLSFAQFNGIRPGFQDRLQKRNARPGGYTAKQNTAAELVTRMQRDYAAETLEAVTAPDYVPTPTRGHVVFRNPNGEMHWIQKGTEFGNSLQGETQKSTGTNDSRVKEKKPKRYIRCGERYRKAPAGEATRLRNSSSSQLPKTGVQIRSHFGSDAPTEAFSQNPTEIFGGYVNNGLVTDPHSSMSQNEPQYSQAMSEYQPWAPNISPGNWPDSSAHQIDPSLQINRTFDSGAPSLVHQLYETPSWDSSSQTQTFGQVFGTGESNQTNFGNPYPAPITDQGAYGVYALPEEGYTPAGVSEGSYATGVHRSVDTYSAQRSQTSAATAVPDERRSKRILRPRPQRK
jgi:hypothetical protein